MHKGYGSHFVCLCIYLFVCTTKSATYLVYTPKTRYHRVLYGVFKVFFMWLQLKMLHSKVLASFAHCHCLPRFVMSSQWAEETAVGSFQQS